MGNRVLAIQIEEQFLLPSALKSSIIPTIVKFSTF